MGSESIMPVTKIDLKNKDGTLLNTEKKYCRQNILVLPKLNALEITENGTYPVPDGFAGNGQVKVSVMPKKETALIVTGNGTYVAPPGTVYTSIVVNVPTESGGDSPHAHKYTSEVIDPSCTMGGYTKYICDCGHSYIADTTAPLMHSYVNGVCERCGEKIPVVEPEVDTGRYAVIVGDVFSIPYHGSSPIVDWPTCLTYYDDGGELVFTAIAAGSGVIRLTRNDSLIGEYTVTVAIVEAYDYDLKIGEQFSVVYDGSSPTVECPRCLTYYDDGGEFVFTAAIVGTGTLWLYRSDSLIASYTIRVSEEDVGSDTHVHNFTHTVTPPTCTDGGYTTHTCTICGFSYRDTPVSARHVPGEPVRVREATCCIPPEYVVYCTRCGEEIYRYEDDGEFAEHIADGGRITTQPTCTTQGVKTYYCRECSTWMREELVAPTGHAYVSVVTPPTCTTEGYTTHTCEKCGHTYTSGKVAASGHVPGEAECVREATCTVAPEYVVKCTVCGVELNRYEDDGKLAEHIADGGRVTKAETCTTQGVKTYYCRECGTWVKEEKIPALGHSWGSPYYSNEFSSGYGQKCTRCGALQELTYVECEHPASAYHESVIKNPTCTVPGSKTCSCDVCRQSWQVAISALGHVWGSPYYSSEFSSGYGRKCSRCGELEELSYVECDHPSSAYSETVITSPTCESKGSKTCSCDVCRSSWSEDIAALGHDWYFDYTVDATCEEGGYDLYRCSRCDDTDHRDETDPNGHNFAGGWVTDVEPTCTASGTKSRTCMSCGETETYDVDPLGHDYELVSDSSQSLGASMVCTRCGDSYEASYDCDILGHETSDGEYDMDDGSTAFKCKHCGEFYN